VPTKAIVDLYSDGLEGKWIQKANEHSTEIPVIQLFGTTMDQTSVLAHVWGYFGYLYFQLPLELEDKLDQVHQVLEVPV
jgi:DNA-binding NtrC family response regulator